MCAIHGLASDSYTNRRTKRGFNAPPGTPELCSDCRSSHMKPVVIRAGFHVSLAALFFCAFQTSAKVLFAELLASFRITQEIAHDYLASKWVCFLAFPFGFHYNPSKKGHPTKKDRPKSHAATLNAPVFPASCRVELDAVVVRAAEVHGLGASFVCGRPPSIWSIASFSFSDGKIFTSDLGGEALPAMRHLGLEGRGVPPPSLLPLTFGLRTRCPTVLTVKLGALPLRFSL